MNRKVSKLYSHKMQARLAGSAGAERRAAVAGLSLLAMSLAVWQPLAAQSTQNTQNNQNDPNAAEVLRQSVTVTERVEVESPAVIDVISGSRIKEIPGVNMDDRLRQIPGFAMFRRTSSVAANPTTQGVNLRGMGSSGASRTLVLWDGIPLNSPFGGWIQWDRLAPDQMSEAEVSRGATTSVWGNQAMGGTINMFTRQPTPNTVTAGMLGGNKGQAQFTGGYSNLFKNNIGTSTYVRGFQTDGYYLIPKQYRGTTDQPAGSDFVAGNTRVDYLGATQRVFLRLDMLGEQRANGTAIQKNSTSAGQMVLSWAKELDKDSLWASAYHAREGYHQTFSSVADDRNSERLVNSQETASEATGLSGLWRHMEDTWNLSVGASYLNNQGKNIDHNPFSGAQTVGAGSRNMAGAFFQVDRNIHGVRVFLGSRFDTLGNGRAFYSPSGGASYGKGIWRVRGSIYRSFRAPTLNELFRPFRVGNVLTTANPNLKPERLFAVEGGLDLTWERRRVSVTYYRNDLRDVITNVTINANSNPILRQRQNLDSAVTHGIETSYNERFNSDWQVQASYLFAHSYFANGYQVPQVPMHNFTAQVIYTHGRIMISPGVRAYSMVWDNDINTFKLPAFGNMTLAASYRLRESLTATLGIDNVTNQQFLIGFPGIPQVGNPTMFRIGLQWDGPVR